MIFTFSPALASIPGLSAFLGEPVAVRFPLRPPAGASVAGWGRKRSYFWAARYAAWHGIRCISLEDGFLRSVGFGRREPPLSLVVDDRGVYYDAQRPSRLELLIGTATPDEGRRRRAVDIRTRWQAGRLSKYNHAREGEQDRPGSFVLVVDQTRGDASIAFGLADARSFARMLEAALDENPGRDVLLKVHPEVMAGRKRGHFENLTPGQAARVRVLGEDVHPTGLLERAAAVYVVTSQMGFEGLLWGRPVRSFGMPFYAGWGLTGDELPAPARRGPVALETLIHAALVDYPRYVDPETGQRCDVERVMEHLAFQRRMRQRFPPRIHALGFGRLRRPMARMYFDGSRLQYHRSGATVPARACVAVWGGTPPRDCPADAGLVHLEDGFLRSVGLGAELVPPLSLVMDRRGIYYDATRPSDLEEILQAARFDPALLQRAAKLRARIVAAGLTKYNVGAGAWARPSGARRVILVPGQVEGDASIRYGAPGIRSNAALLAEVRAENPDAHVLYKPHPDVSAGLRDGGSGLVRARSLCDAVVTDVPMDRLLGQVDEVHLLTSLTGFEALLRELPVVTYGQPFYAGWGLTVDKAPPARRTRRLSLDELVAGVLILYPVYASRVTGRYTTPERALDELLAWRRAAALPQGLYRRLRQTGLRRLISLHNRIESLRREQPGAPR